jgi:hypothetical protein
MVEISEETDFGLKDGHPATTHGPREPSGHPRGHIKLMLARTGVGTALIVE